MKSLPLATRSKTIGRSLQAAGQITFPRLSPVITELIFIRRFGAGPNRSSKQPVIERIADLRVHLVMNCRLTALLILQSGGDGFIEDLRSKSDVTVVIKTLRFMHAVHVDCKFQKSLWRLPRFNMLRFWRRTGVVTVVVVDHGLVKGVIVS